MKSPYTEGTIDSRVAIVQTGSRAHENNAADEAQASDAISRIAKELDWTDEERGPFGKLIPDGARVLVKPNFVMHENQGPWGIEPLITHQSLIRATVDAVLQT